MLKEAGLFSKYHIRTPDEQPLDSGAFVLRPFNADGTVRDGAALAALRHYAENTPFKVAGVALLEWLEEPRRHPATGTLNIPSK